MKYHDLRLWWGSRQAERLEMSRESSVAARLILTGVLILSLVSCRPGAGDRAATTTSVGPPTTTSIAVATTPPTEPTTLPSTTSTTAPATTTTTEAPAAPVVVLRHDGLGLASFGEPVDSVMAELTEVLGPPDWEEIQISADVDFSAAWGPDGDEFLYLQFTYWDYFDAAPSPPGPMPEGPVFHYYLTKSGAVATEAGITVGSNVADLVAAYPNVRFDLGCTGNEFVLDPTAGWLQLPMWGLLDGESDNSATRIVYIGAGWDRSPC